MTINQRLDQYKHDASEDTIWNGWKLQNLPFDQIFAERRAPVDDRPEGATIYVSKDHGWI